MTSRKLGKASKQGIALTFVGIACAIAALLTGHYAGLEIHTVGFVEFPASLPEPLHPYYMDLLMSRTYPLFAAYLWLRAAALFCFLAPIVLAIRSQRRINRA